MSKKSQKQIALLGGSFDPPHLAHLQVVDYLLKQNRFDEIWIIPAGQHPFKNAQASFEDRLEMSRLAFAALGPTVRIQDVERDSPGYTLDLINRLQAAYPAQRFTFVGGSDLEKEFSQWKDPETLKQKLDFLFLPRPPDAASPFSDISSTEIRRLVKNRLPISNFVPKAVADYIDAKQLYR